MPYRPDLIECWVFRVAASGRVDYLLIRRAPGRIFAGLWQCVTGAVEAGERVPETALRELAEETGLGPTQVEGFYDLDMAYEFYDEGPDAMVVAAAFAVRVAADGPVTLSHEHDEARWVERDDALRLAIWPAYEEAIRRIERSLLDPAAAPWFELSPEGRRLAR
ncbi:MAG TPA: NUDIX domain-containing protein [Candidatus Dormibacteraeota bacterium]|nr:NUDIX domain-containing protein [Candidatus Dormibacteraeota bacterium]